MPRPNELQELAALVQLMGAMQGPQLAQRQQSASEDDRKFQSVLALLGLQQNVKAQESARALQQAGLDQSAALQREGFGLQREEGEASRGLQRESLGQERGLRTQELNARLAEGAAGRELTERELAQRDAQFDKTYGLQETEAGRRARQFEDEMTLRREGLADTRVGREQTLAQQARLTTDEIRARERQGAEGRRANQLLAYIDAFSRDPQMTQEARMAGLSALDPDFEHVADTVADVDLEAKLSALAPQFQGLKQGDDFASGYDALQRTLPPDLFKAASERYLPHAVGVRDSTPEEIAFTESLKNKTSPSPIPQPRRRGVWNYFKE